MSESKFSLGPALAQFRKLGHKKGKEEAGVSGSEAMPEANSISIAGVTREEPGAEIASALPTSAVADNRTELHSKDLKRQQPEAWEIPELEAGHRPLKRLRKESSTEEAAADAPIALPSGLEDSMSKGSSHRREADAEGAASEAAEERGEPSEKRDGGGDVDREGDEEGEQEDDEDEAKDGWRANDTICTKCDDGGELILCDGGCMRAFHAGIKPAEEEEEGPVYVDDPGSCNPLQIGAELFMRFDSTNEPFMCPNCHSGKHQCFACKVEGSVGGSSSGLPEVFKCTVGDCGRFYHARCLNKDPQEMAIFFVCPLHTCKRCNEGENAEKGEVISCRRCPVAYHAGCLPKKILNSPVTRVWITRKLDKEGNVLPPPLPRTKAVEPECDIGQSLLYCMRHDMALGDATPVMGELFSPQLRRLWAKAQATKFPDLLWSRDIMDRFAARAERRRQQAKQNAQAERAATQASKQAGVARAVPQAAPKKAAVSKGAAPAAGAAVAVPKRPRTKPQPAPAASAAAAVARKPAPVAIDDNEIPLAVRIAAGRKAQQQRPQKPAPIVVEAEYIPFEDTPAEPVPAVRPPSPVKPPIKKDSASAPRQSEHEKRLPAPDTRGDASAAPVEAEAVQAEEAAVPEPEMSPAVPDVLPPAKQPMVRLLPRLSSEEGAPEEVARPRTESAADAPEDDMWAADADEEADDADAEAADLVEAAPLDLEAEAAAAEAARSARQEAAAAAQALEEEESHLLPCERESHWTKGAMQERLNAWWGEADLANSLRDVEANSRKPKPYQNSLEPTITRDRLDGHVKACRGALDNPHSAQLMMGRLVNELYRAEDNLRMVLAPVLHGASYTSYGRHFTLPYLLEEVNKYLLPFMLTGDTVVDFSCGYNVWLPMLKRMGLAEGLEIHGRAFDIITAKDTEDFVKSSWLDVDFGQLPRGDKLVIGLNPPFGKNGCLASKFVTHAAQFQPRVIVLIAPPGTIIPPGYIVMLEETRLMAGEAFFKPGVDKASWNDVPPSTRILIREDYFTLALDRTGPHTQVICTHEFQHPPRMPPQMLPVFGQMPLHHLGPPMGFNMQQGY